MKVNGIEITEATILATRQHYVDIDRLCIAHALSGQMRVNDLSKYIIWKEKHIADMIEGKSDYTLTFVQCALWIQTGECIAILA